MLLDIVTVSLLIAGISILVLLTFLPAIIELKTPKDSGPRMIVGEASAILIHSTNKIRIADIEVEQQFDGSIIDSLAKIIEVLPNLEVWLSS